MNIKQDLPRFCVLALLTGLLGCPGTSAVVNPGRNSSLAKGIPGYGATKLDFPDGRNRKFRIKISEPVIVAVASGPQGWGFFQFPSITRWTDRTLSASWSMAADSVVSYSKGGSGNAISKDGGKTWEPLTGPRGIAGLLLPNGDRIAVTTPRPAKVSELRLPRPIGETTDTYSKMKYVLYRLAELPPDQQAVYLRRLPKGESLWVSERARLDDPQALRYSVRGLFPIVWWGDLQLAADGSLVAGIYPGIRMREGGSPDQRWGVFFYRSTDDGHSWHVQGRIPYQPDLRADAKGAARMGFSEPAFQILPDGSFLCVMRTTDGFGNGPMYAARSKDSGRTWSKPARIAPSGVLPRLLCLENGMTVLCSGRPGVQLRFSDDVAVARWSKSLELLPYEIGGNETTEQMWRGEVVSCGYTGLLATGPDRFLVIYSDFQHRNEAGEIRKAIKIREVTVVRPSSSP